MGHEYSKGDRVRAAERLADFECTIKRGTEVEVVYVSSIPTDRRPYAVQDPDAEGATGDYNVDSGSTWLWAGDDDLEPLDEGPRLPPIGSKWTTPGNPHTVGEVIEYVTGARVRWPHGVTSTEFPHAFGVNFFPYEEPKVEPGDEFKRLFDGKVLHVNEVFDGTAYGRIYSPSLARWSADSLDASALTDSTQWEKL